LGTGRDSQAKQKLQSRSENLFKGAAIVAATKPGPFAEFYAELLAKGMRQEMARLTLAPSSGGDRSHRIDVLVSAVAGGTGH
jgi:hypothetical protein